MNSYRFGLICPDTLTFSETFIFPNQDRPSPKQLLDLIGQQSDSFVTLFVFYNPTNRSKNS